MEIVIFIGATLIAEVIVLLYNGLNIAGNEASSFQMIIDFVHSQNWFCSKANDICRIIDNFYIKKMKILSHLQGKLLMEKT